MMIDVLVGQSTCGGIRIDTSRFGTPAMWEFLYWSYGIGLWFEINERIGTPEGAD